MSDIEIGDAPSHAWLSVYLAGITLSRRDLAPLIPARVPAARAFCCCATKMGPRPRRSASSPRCGDRRVCDDATVGAGEARPAVSCGAVGVGRARGGTIAGAAGRRRQRPAQGLYRKLAYQRVGGYHYACLTREVPRADCCQPNLLAVDWSKIPPPATMARSDLQDPRYRISP